MAQHNPEPVERPWKLLRHRATHNRLFEHVDQLHAVLRKHLDWLQVHREPVRSVLGSSLLRVNPLCLVY